MKTRDTICDNCGARHPYDRETVEVRRIASLTSIQFQDTSRPGPLDNHPTHCSHIYDFCNQKCLMEYLAKTPDMFAWKGISEYTQHRQP